MIDDLWALWNLYCTQELFCVISVTQEVYGVPKPCVVSHPVCNPVVATD